MLILFVKKSRENCFTTVELMVSIGIIVLLTGMFLLNYNFQGKFRDLTNSSHIILQEIREVQSFVVSSSKPPLECNMTSMPQSYGLQFKDGDDFFDVFVDKDGDNDYDLGGTNCTCTDVNNECIKRVFIPVSIQISDIIINAGFIDESNPSSGRINFFIDDLTVKMNGEDKKNIKIETCIKSDCLANIKKITVNSKGAVEIE